MVIDESQLMDWETFRRKHMDYRTDSGYVDEYTSDAIAVIEWRLKGVRGGVNELELMINVTGNDYDPFGWDDKYMNVNHVGNFDLEDCKTINDFYVKCKGNISKCIGYVYTQEYLCDGTRTEIIAKVPDVFKEKVKEYSDADIMEPYEFEEKYQGNDGSSINNIALLELKSDFYAQKSELRYAVHDIDGNGTKELIIANDYCVVDIYTEHNGKQIKLFENAQYCHRDRLQVTMNGSIIHVGSGGADLSMCTFMKIDPLTGRISKDVESYYYDNLDICSDREYGTRVSREEYLNFRDYWTTNSVLNNLEWQYF